MASTQLSNDDRTIEELWQEAEAYFQDLTNGKTLRGAKSNSSMQDLMNKLDMKYGSGKSGEHAKTKKVILDVLSVIQTIGGIAVQVVSTVFAPAQMCFNAASFLLEIPSRIDKVFGSVGSLFEALQGYLVKLKIYRRIETATRVPFELKTSINRILCKFVEISALAYGLAFGSKSGKVKAIGRAALFQDDSGITTSLKEFGRLVEEQMKLESTLNLESTLIIEKSVQVLPEMSSEIVEIRKTIDEGMETLVSDQQARSTEKNAEEQRRLLMKLLDISKEALDEQEAAIEAIRKDCFENSADLLRQDTDYSKWSDLTSDAKPVLFLSGESGSGKSFLVQSILDAMNVMNVPDFDGGVSVGRVVVAHYLFPKSDDRSMATDKARNNRRDQQIEIALKHIAYQVTRHDKVYAKDLINTQKKPVLKSTSLKELWDNLLLGRPRGDVCHVLVFDGVDQVSVNDLGDFFKDIIEPLQNPGDADGSWTAFPHRSKLRVLVSSTPGSFPSELITIPILDAVELNTDNIIAFIERELKPGNLWNEHTQQTRALEDYIREYLPENCGGDFSTVVQALESAKIAVRNNRNLQAAKQAIWDVCHRSSEDMASNAIEELNRTLSSQDIKTLNDLLTWVMGCSPPLNMKQLRAALFLETREDPLQPLETTLRTKYGSVFELLQNDTVVVRDHVEQYLRNDAKDRQSVLKGSSSAGPRITMEIKIQNATIAQVKKFLWNLTEQAVVDPFLFVDSNTQAEDKILHVHIVDSLLHVTIKLLDVLNDDYNEITEPIFVYAATHIMRFLKMLRDDILFDLLKQEEIKTIVCGIINFLSDSSTFGQHHIEDVIEAISVEWFEDQHRPMVLSHPLSGWLSAAENTSLLDRQDLRRLSVLTDRRNGLLSFFWPIAKLMAERWLHGDMKTSEDYFLWLHFFLDSERYWQTPLFLRHIPAGPINVEALPVLTHRERIERALTWVKTNMPDLQQNDEYFLRLGDLYWAFELSDEAIEVFQEGKRLSPKNWHLSSGLASTYADQKQYSRAISEMEHALQIVRNQPDVDLKEEQRYILYLRRLIDWYIKMERFEDAIQECKKAIQVKPTDLDMYGLLLEATSRSGDVTQFRKYFDEAFDGQKDDGSLITTVDLMEAVLDGMFDRVDRTVYRRVFMGSREAGAVTSLLSSIRKVQQTARAVADRTYQAMGQTLEARTLFYLADKPEDIQDIDLAVSILEKVVQDEENLSRFNNDDVRMRRVFEAAYPFLTAAYLRQALANLSLDKDKQLPDVALQEISSGMNNESDSKGKNEPVIAKLRDLVKTSSRRRLFDPLMPTCLVGYFAATGEPEKAREVLRPVLEEYLEMLVDDIDENDLEAFCNIAFILSNVRDDKNALIAWTLFAPFDADIEPIRMSDTESESDGQSEGDSTSVTTNEEIKRRDSNSNPAAERPISQIENSETAQTDNVESTLPPKPVFMKMSKDFISPITLNKERLSWEHLPDAPGHVLVREYLDQEAADKIFRDSISQRDMKAPISWACAGKCGKIWFWASDFYVCKFCCRMMYCKSCLDELKNGTSRHFSMCSAQHDWLYVPPWSWQRYKELGSRFVRVGDEILHFREWLIDVRKDWGLLKGKPEILWVPKYANASE